MKHQHLLYFSKSTREISAATNKFNFKSVYFLNPPPPLDQHRKIREFSLPHHEDVLQFPISVLWAMSSFIEPTVPHRVDVPRSSGQRPSGS